MARPRPLRFPRLNSSQDDQQSEPMAERYELKIPCLGGQWLDWKLYDFDVAVTPREAAVEILMRYDGLVESGKLPRGKGGGQQSSPCFTSEIPGITVFVRTIPESHIETGDDDDTETYVDIVSGRRRARSQLFKFSAYTAVKLEYHVFTTT